MYNKSLEDITSPDCGHFTSSSTLIGVTRNQWLDIAQFDFVDRIFRMFIKIENIEIYML
jgi:hypothetical protein